MRSRWHRKVLVLSLLLVVTTPLLVRAECITVPASQVTGPVAEPTLVFTGTVVDSDLEAFEVSFRVERVWKGRLHRDTTAMIVGGECLVSPESFRLGVTYLVISHYRVFGPEDHLEPLGLIGIMVSSATPLAQVNELLEKLGPSSPPLP